MHLFTYGTLMFPAVWNAVVGRAFEAVECEAAGYSIFGVEGADYPGMVATSETDIVRGLLYLNVDHASLTRLDQFEGDLYARQSLWVACSDGQRRAAEAYLVATENQHALTGERWRPEVFLASGGLERFLGTYPGFESVPKSS